MNFLSLSALLFGAVLAQEKPCGKFPGLERFGPDPNNGSALVQMTSCERGLDAPKIGNFNSTSYDWWYFDAVSEDATASLVVVFFLRGASAGFPGPAFIQDVPWVQVTGSLPNGTIFRRNIPVDEASVLTTGDGSSGTWGNSSISWFGAPNLSKYKVKFGGQDNDLTGTLTLEAIVPPHAPCGPWAANQPLDVMPNVGWANSIPDGNAVVDIMVGDTPMKFRGIGYHDKNWGVRPFNQVVGSWAWGHARMGPYSIVWLDALSKDYVSYPSAYIARDGKIVSADCGSIQVRPMGANSTFPPTVDSGRPEAFSIEALLQTGETLTAHVRSNVDTQHSQLYMRWVGTINGTVGNETDLEGVTSYEMFNFF